MLSRPLSEYRQFALLGYQGNVLAGEDVRIADRDTHPGVLDPLNQDFWMLDENLVFVMRYHDDGTLAAVDPATDTTPYLAMRSLAVAHSVPLTDYLPLVRDEIRREW